MAPGGYPSVFQLAAHLPLTHPLARAAARETAPYPVLVPRNCGLGDSRCDQQGRMGGEGRFGLGSKWGTPTRHDRPTAPGAGNLKAVPVTLSPPGVLEPHFPNSNS